MNSDVEINDFLLQEPAVSTQVIYLDFDGGETVYCNNDLDLNFDVTVADSEISEENKKYILSELSSRYCLNNIFFTIEKPEDDQKYSTIFIGRTDDFDEYGIFAGLAETIDENNQIKDDNAFVLVNNIDGLDSIISVIEHEIGHITEGQEHGLQQNDLSDYALTVTQSGTLRDVILECGSSVSVSYKSYTFTVHVPDGREVILTMEYDFEAMVNCSQVSIWKTVNGKNAEGSQITLTETSVISLYIVEKISNPYIYTYYAKCNITIDVQYYTPIPQADLKPYVKNGWSDALIIANNTDSQTHQSTFTTDDTLYLTGFYANVGTLAAAPFYLEIRIDGKTFTGGYVSELPVNTGDGFRIAIGKLSVGQHTITVVLDTGNTVNESNENNNTISKTITVKDATLPDLKISAVHLPENITDHHLYEIGFSVTNTGRTQAGAFTVQVFDGAEKISEFTINSLASGGSITRSLTIQPGELASGSHDLRFVVDPADAVKETDETNNIKQAALTVSTAKDLPETPAGYSYSLSGNSLLLSWENPDASNGDRYQLRFQDKEGNFTAPMTVTGNSCTVTAPEMYTSWQIRRITADQLYSDWSDGGTYYTCDRGNGTGNVFSFTTQESVDSVTWSFDDYEHELNIVVPFRSKSGLDIYALPRGVIKAVTNVGYRSSGNTWQKYWDDELIIISNGVENEKTEKFTSNGNGNFDIFLGNANGTWEEGFAAQHVGILDGWTGSGEIVLLSGKNKISDIFEGSADANVLLLTDDANGDAIFLDDIYSALGNQARLSQIDTIQAGGGDDVIDLTSQRYQSSNSMEIYGGDGDDTIWANSGQNTLYGDAGNDNLIGGSDDDLIIGGRGNDTMNGGGGEDLFTFGTNWGNDIVTQVAGGSIRLWFDEGSIDKWDAEALIYRDGNNSVTVIGVSVENITFEFGYEGGFRHYSEYAIVGAFNATCSDVNIIPWKSSPYRNF